LSLSFYHFPFQNPRSPGTSPLGLASLKRKNLPIEVTLGGIGSCYTSLAFYLIAFTPSYKLCDNRKQSNIALSTPEVEYIVACFASCEAIWLRKLLTDLFDLEMEATTILCDNQRCIKMTENPLFHDRSKHIEIRYHYIRDMVERGALKL
jgi:hypothetical protein